MQAKKDFSALIGGLEITAKAGEAIDPKLNKRVIAKLKTQGLIINKKEAKDD